jgi:hypothetical protein
LTKQRHTEPKPNPPPLSERMQGFVVLVALFSMIGLATADLVGDGDLNDLWILALLVLVLTFGGYKADRLLELLFGRRGQ